MANVSNAISLINNVGTNVTPDSVDVAGTDVTINSWTPLNGGQADTIDFQTGGSLTLENSTAITTVVSFDTGRGADDDTIDLNNGTIVILKTTSGDTNPGPVRGTIRSRGGTMTRLGNTAGGDSGGRYFFGTTSAQHLANFDVDGLTINGADGQLTVGLSGVNTQTDTPRLDGLSFVGDAFLEMPPFKLNFFGLAASPGASGAQLATTGTSGNFNGSWYGYSQRFLHFGYANSNVLNATDELPPVNAQLITNYDISQVTAEGSFGGTGNALTSTNPQSILQFNRNAATWWLNPDFGGRDVNFGFHFSNAPTSTNPAEIRTFLASRPHFNDPLNQAITTDTRVTYPNIIRAIPAAWDNTSPAAAINLNRLVVNSNDGNGVMVQTGRLEMAPGTNTVTGQNPANFSISPPATDLNYFVQNFRYDLPYEVPLGSGDVCTGLTTATPRVTLADADLLPFLNDRTENTAPAGNITEWADIVPTLRRNWFFRSPSTTETVPVEMVGNVATFNRGSVTFSTGNTTFDTTSITIGASAGLIAGTGENRVTNFDFGGANVTISQAIPAGLTVSNGEFRGIGNGFDGVTFGASSSIQVTSNIDLTAITFTGVPTFVSPTGTRTIAITSDQATQLGVTDGQTVNTPGGGAVTFNIAQEAVTFVASLVQSALFGTDTVNFDGYVTVVRNSSGSRSIIQGPTHITDSNRASFAFSPSLTSANVGSDIIEVTTVGDKWTRGFTSFTGTDMANVTIPIIADILYQRTADLNGTVGTVTGSATSLAVPITGTGTINGVAQANRFVGSIRSNEQYARTVALSGNADFIRYEATTVPPIVDTSIITFSSGDANQQSIPGLSVEGGGTLATTATVSAATVIVGAAPIGLQATDVVDALGNSTLGATINDTNQQLTDFSVLDRL